MEAGKRKMEGQRGQLEGVGREEMGTVDETARTRSDSGSKPHRRLPALPTGSPEVTTKVCGSLCIPLNSIQQF